MMFNEKFVQEENNRHNYTSDPVWKRVGRVLGGIAIFGGVAAFSAGMAVNFMSDRHENDHTNIAIDTPKYLNRNDAGSELLVAGLAAMSLGLSATVVCGNSNNRIEV